MKAHYEYISIAQGYIISDNGCGKRVEGMREVKKWARRVESRALGRCYV